MISLVTCLSLLELGNLFSVGSLKCSKVAIHKHIDDRIIHLPGQAILYAPTNIKYCNVNSVEINGTRYGKRMYRANSIACCNRHNVLYLYFHIL